MKTEQPPKVGEITRPSVHRYSVQRQDSRIVFARLFYMHCAIFHQRFSFLYPPVYISSAFPSAAVYRTVYNVKISKQDICGGII